MTGQSTQASLVPAQFKLIRDCIPRIVKCIVVAQRYSNCPAGEGLLEKSKVVVPGKADLEISHHYGLEKFEETGLTMIVVNREYCKSFW